ncbi:ABC-type lipoprotein release transport system permease subunit [Geothermobacter ehrlichii]|uniref:ABC-type lipoprotein release transport system permease subunit n=1 Tax=Geothermobacter ehrlichii TaxID=213224 RepID=A0A5D3WK13_9BACT|nr:FtsX-like permease family protein [Geothermobacter ehrlichii]TYO98688.1 ABC-type lipoprotein release transport system permease subunit [Geothermobacter ehrlichii]
MTDLKRAPLLHLAWKNIWRNRRRTLITLAAVALSVTLVQAFHNLSHGVYRQMIDNGVRAGSGHLAIYHRGYLQSRDERLLWSPKRLPADIAALPGVTAVLPRIYLAGLAQSSRESRGIVLTGVDPAAERAVNPFLKQRIAGEPFSRADSRKVIIGERLLRELKLKPGQKLVITVQRTDGELASELFRVGAVIRTGLREIDGSLVMAGRERVANLAGQPGTIHELAVILDTAERDRQVAPAVASLLEGRNELGLVPWDLAMPNLANAIKLDYASQKFIFLIILLIVAIGVVNTQLMSVMERQREFGVLLAIGSSPARLRRLVLFEGLLLGGFAGLVGSLLGALATLYLAEIGIDLRRFLPENLEFGGVVFDPVLRATWDFGYMLRIAVYVVVLSLLAGLYPAHRAGRIRPAEAMRKV